MDKIIEFVGNNYSWFLTITIILLFALIGYIYDNRNSKKEIDNQEEDKKEDVILEEVKNEDPILLEDEVSEKVEEQKEETEVSNEVQ